MLEKHIFFSHGTYVFGYVLEPQSGMTNSVDPG